MFPTVAAIITVAIPTASIRWRRIYGVSLLAGSILSAVVGFLVLRLAVRRRATVPDEALGEPI